MKITAKTTLATLITVALPLSPFVTGCGGGGGGDDGSSAAPTPTAGVMAVSGTVTKGTIINGLVKVWALDPQGIRVSPPLGSGNTAFRCKTIRWLIEM